MCPAGFEFRLGECRESRCAADSDCCPGQRCNEAAGFCADQLVACSTDQQCIDVPGQKCIDFRGGQFCGYPNKGNVLSTMDTQTCESNQECDEGRTCVGRRCLTSAPCAGGCADNEICDLDTNTCYAYECGIECAPGQIKVVSDPDTMAGPSCCLLGCVCATLPEVKVGQYGWYSSLAVAQDSVLVSSYDSDYGDLVVSEFDNEGQLQSVTYVDGFVTTDPVVGDPNGLRSGRDVPGPNVGEHTSIIVDDAQVVHVAYYDIDNGTLMYASRAGGVWSKSLVDETGNTGLYTSIAINESGNPQISYMMAEGTIGNDPTNQSALKLAKATTNMPMGIDDWAIETIESVPVPVPVCNGGCGSGQACVDLGNGPSCVDTTVGCGSCESGESCVENMGMKECIARISITKSDDLFEGTGLFSSMVVTSSGTSAIAYYDRINRRLRLAVETSTGTFRITTLDASDPTIPSDSGQHVSLAIGPNDELGAAFIDAIEDNLLFVDLRSGTTQLIDDGVTSPNKRFVGADASLVFDANGNPAVAYQDSSNIDLIYARKTATSTTWSTEVLYGGPMSMELMGTASGFYISQGRRDNTAYISNVDVDFSEEGALLLNLTVLSKDLN